MGTPITSGRSYDEQVVLAAELLQHLEIDRAAVLGISQSGPFPLMFALRYPEQVTCLVEYSAITKPWDIDEHWGSVAGRLLLTDVAMWMVWNLVSVFGWGILVDTWCRAYGVDASGIRGNPKMEDLFRALVEVALPPSALKDALENDAEQAKALPRLVVEEISCPILVLHGTKDTAVPVEHGRFVADHAPRAEAHFFEGGSHVLMLDPRFSEEADRALLDFLRRNAPGGATDRA